MLMNTSGQNKRGAVIPVVMAVMIAVAGTAAMFLVEFRSNGDVARNGISMITAASADRAGATAHPTEPAVR